VGAADPRLAAFHLPAAADSSIRRSVPVHVLPATPERENVAPAILANSRSASENIRSTMRLAHQRLAAPSQNQCSGPHSYAVGGLLSRLLLD